jgi:3-hydroxyacyl-[acyl-carrier-protein] dehydratase
VSVPDRTAAPTIGYHQLRDILPHGAQMLLLDRIEQLEPGRRLHALKAISGDEPPYAQLPAGVPVGRRAYPSALILESFGQAAAVLWYSGHGRLVENAEQVLMFALARRCRFERPAYAGDVLCHQVQMENVVADTAFVTGSTWVGQRRVADFGSLAAVLRPAPTPPPAPVPRPTPALAPVRR